MGSGCYNGSVNGFFGTPIPDKGVVYTGPSIPALDICTNDRLNEVEAIILAKLLQFAEGKGIILADINLEECDFLKEFIECCNGDKSLDGLITLILKAICSLKGDLTDLETKVNEVLNMTLDLKCLSVPNPSLKNILNELIKQFCLLEERVSVLEQTVIDLQNQIDTITNSLESTIKTILDSILNERIGNFLLNHIFSCNGFGISKSGTGASAVIQFNGMVPPYCPIPYVGSLSNFDNTGAGIPEKGYCGWFICNGQNNTPDMRGYTFASATTGVTGGGLDAKVSGNPTTYLSKIGESKVSILTANLPTSTTSSTGSHSHKMRFENVLRTVYIYGATGTGITPFGGGTGGSPGAMLNLNELNPLNPSEPTSSYSTSVFEKSTSTATFTTSSSGGENQPLENRQPTYNGVWIMRFN